MKAELQARLQVARKRDEWMTTLPPERKSGVVRMYSMTRFSKSSKESRGDTSVWTDTPSVRAQKVKMNHLELQHLLIKNCKKRVDQVSMLNWWYIITKRDDQNLW
ncbi:hypothetical protein RDI58_000349 [Solanum bulbocastanum]|uniref:DUF3752 domain-containing protein n=1 Tax=Solanum bulbocastanum TaxID=147425 RepID=A0AAN8U380_SOLBU